MVIRYLLAALLCLALTSQAAVAQLQRKGADKKVEWELVRELDVVGKPVDIAHSLDGKYAFILTEESQVLVYDAEGALQGAIPVDAGVSAITLDPLGTYLHLSDKDQKKFYTLAIDFTLKINSANAPVKGRVDAPVTIAVFSDFQ